MSYCRNNGKDSDVYVLASRDPKRQKDIMWCCGCEMSRDGDKLKGTVCDSKKEMVQHLREHRRQGDMVPERAFERLRLEIDAE